MARTICALIIRKSYQLQPSQNQYIIMTHVSCFGGICNSCLDRFPQEIRCHPTENSEHFHRNSFSEWRQETTDLWLNVLEIFDGSQIIYAKMSRPKYLDQLIDCFWPNISKCPPIFDGSHTVYCHTNVGHQIVDRPNFPHFFSVGALYEPNPKQLFLIMGTL